MSLPHRAVRAGDDQARRRLSLYARFAELVAAQERALEDEDLGRFKALSVELDWLRRAVGDLAPPAGATPEASGPGADRPAPAAHADENAAREVLEEALAATRRIESRLAGMKRSGAAEIRGLERRASHVRSYFRTAGDDAGTSRLDLTS